MLKKQLEMKQTIKKVNFLAYFLGKLGDSFLGHLLASKGLIQASEEIITTGQGF